MFTRHLPHDLCARINNAFRARHQKLAVDHTTQNLGVLSVLLRTGFISSLTRGTIESPSPSDFLNAPIAQRRIWADLKYRDDLPVLSSIESVSKPSKRVLMTLNDIRLVCTGRTAQNIRPLGMSEILVIHTKEKEHDYIEAREALNLRLGGEVLLRAG
ncbi:ribosomal protein S8 [Flagelloscypha sp. PMI_526]|nr:ribosomal protein S8 [Flagelloscypha sp. PMI_526]